jgi:hypothetical protein
MNRSPLVFLSPLFAALLLTTAMFTSAPHLDAQTREGGPLVLQLPSSAAALSLGTAFPLSRRFSEVIFYNPSLLSRVDGFGAGLARFGSQSTLVNLSAGTSWGGGAVGIGVQSLSYRTAASTIREIPKGVSDLLSGGGDSGVSEMVVSGAYARSFFGIRWGMTAKLIEQRFNGSRGSTVAADVGASKNLGRVTVGLAAQNLGDALEVDGTELDLAERITLGAAFHGWQVGELDLGASLALSREADGAYIPAGGLEVAWWPVVGRTFIARVGLRRVVDSPAQNVTFGGSFIGDAITIEYAYQGHDGFDASHRFGVSWR